MFYCVRNLACISVCFLLLNSAVAVPNIVFVLTDDHAKRASSVYDDDITVTPNMQRLADAGLYATKMVTTNPICAPARATLMTGQYSQHHGVIKNHYGSSKAPAESSPQIGTILHDNGYSTAFVGKHHSRYPPPGFEYTASFKGQGNYRKTRIHYRDTTQVIAPRRDDFDRYPTIDGPMDVTSYISDDLTTIAIDWLDNKRDDSKPFALFLFHKAPHHPFTPSAEYIDLYDTCWQASSYPPTLYVRLDGLAEGSDPSYLQSRKSYGMGNYMSRHLHEDSYCLNGNSAIDNLRKKRRYRRTMTTHEIFESALDNLFTKYMSCVKSVDDSIGELLDWLENNGVMSNTVFVYSSDQGYFLGEFGRYDKRLSFDASILSPFIIRYDGVIPSATSTDVLMGNVDIMPTLLDYAGLLSSDVEEQVDGTSLRPYLEGTASGGDKPNPNGVLIEYNEQPAYRAIRTDDMMYTRVKGRRAEEVYDCASDPDQQYNIAVSQDSVRQSMSDQLDTLYNSIYGA